VPSHEGIVDNEMADQLAKTGTEPACANQLELQRKRSRTGGIDITENIRNPQLGSNRQRDLYQGTEDLLKLNRDQLRWVVRLCTGHSPKGTPFQTGIDR
jgi:hypothetical protein